jgi:hypothetical protein
MRRALDLAVTSRLTRAQWDVLGVILSLIGTYCRYGDHLAHSQLAVTVHVKTVPKVLRSLKLKGIILYEPGRGRGQLSWIGLPEGEQGLAPFPEGEKVAGGVRKGSRTGPKREPNGSEKGAELGSPPEIGIREGLSEIATPSNQVSDNGEMPCPWCQGTRTQIEGRAEFPCIYCNQEGREP